MIRFREAAQFLVFNHASYMDAVVVAAVLPGEPTYVAKKEFAGQVFAGPLLRRLGVLFIDRFDLADSLTDLDKRLSYSTTATTSGVLPRGHIHSPGWTFRLLPRCLQGRGAGKASGRTRRYAWNTFDAAGRSMVPTLEPDYRDHRVPH